MLHFLIFESLLIYLFIDLFSFFFKSGGSIQCTSTVLPRNPEFADFWITCQIRLKIWKFGKKVEFFALFGMKLKNSQKGENATSKGTF